MSDTQRPPLWRVMAVAWFQPGAPTVGHRWANVIRALRDRMVPFALAPGGHRPDPDYEHYEWAFAQRLRAQLTAEAERAERGEQ